jgi:transcriptional regulator
MYQTDFYRCDDPEKLSLFVKSYPLAVVSRAGDASGNFVCLPLIVDEWTAGRRTLLGHIDNENPFLDQLKAATTGVHAIFLGPNGYISPNYYVSKQLPTWNYSVIQICGTIILITDEAEKASRMVEMVNSLERDQRQPFVLDREDARIRQFIARITFFGIEVTEIKAVFKYSQDKHREDVLAARSALLQKLEDVNKFVLSKIVE